MSCSGLAARAAVPLAAHSARTAAGQLGRPPLAVAVRDDVLVTAYRISEF
jgi:hypothetical protein